MLEGCGGCCFTIGIIVLLCCVVVAGAAIYVYANGPEPPLTGRFRPNAIESQEFDNAINQAVSDAIYSSGFTLYFTERQISSWLALEGQNFADDYDHAFPFENVQMELEDGEMTFYGELKYGNLTLPMVVLITPQVDSAGKLVFDIKKVDVGGVKAPDFVLKTIVGQLEDKLLKPFEDLQGDYVLDANSLSIQNGIFYVRGQIKY